MSRAAASLTRVATAALVALAGAPLLAEDAAAPAYAAGAATFKDNCAVCHGPAGGGIPALAPPLSANPARYAASAEGRRQLALTVLYGMFGDIVVDDKHYNFQMPEFSRFDDATLAATLNFVVFDLDHAGTDVKPLAAADVAAERAHPLDASAVREHRKTVVPPTP